MTEADSVNDVSFRQPQIVSQEVETIFPLSVTNAGGAGGCGTRMQSGAMELGRRLLLAARAGDTSLVLDLMAKGAPFTNDWLGTSPLHLAASNAHADTCGVLLRAGVSRESRTKVDRTPLHLAAYAGHDSVVELLLQHGAQVDCRDMLRMTPLHWAAERGHAAVAAALLRAGAELRPRNKFRKTPQQLAAARAHTHVLALLDDECKRREAARSVRAIVADRPVEETAAPEPQQPVGIYTTVHRNIQEVKIKPKPVQEKAAKTEIKAEKIEAAAAGKEGAAALLRRHGITLLPADDTSTVLNALQSGRTVVLSDAGKLMLKESEDAPAAHTSVLAAATPPSGAGSGAGGKASRGMVLTATPVRTTPLGVKVFTVNNRLSATTGEIRPRAKIMTSQDLQQLKIVQLPPDARIVSPRKVPRRLRVAPAPTLAPLAPAPSPAPAPAPLTPARQPVKIIMNKCNFERLVAGAKLDLADAPDATHATHAIQATHATHATRATHATHAIQAMHATPAPVATPVTVTQNVSVVDASHSETASLRASLAAAQARAAALSDELRQCRARLARYEPQDQ